MSNNNNNKATKFFKKNGLYLLLALCIIAIGLSVALSLTGTNDPIIPDNSLNNDNITNEGNGNTNEPDEIPDDTPSSGTEDPSDTPVSTVITFAMPVTNASKVTEYSETMVFNSTLNRFSAHKAIDFFAEEGTPVLAVYKGTVENVETSLLQGVTVTIDHGNGLKTVYNSLEDGEDVFIGQKVEQGDVIGYVSTSNKQEYKEGAHLHFSVIENGEVIDPSKYLTINEK